MLNTNPTTNSGNGWLECLEYAGRGAKDPAGYSMPQGWSIRDLVASVIVFRSKKIVEVDPDKDLRKTDRVIKAVLNENLIEMLYGEDDRAILITPSNAAPNLTRLEWYQKYGRDGLRTLATSAMKGNIGRDPFRIP